MPYAVACTVKFPPLSLVSIMLQPNPGTKRAQIRGAAVNYWVEISELDHGHGGAGWELGSCLWSPTLDRNGRNRYRMMREVKIGDPVFHLIRRNGDRALVGRSTASGSATTVTQTPPEPGKWAGFPSYFRVPLEGFKAFDPPPLLKDIEGAHWERHSFRHNTPTPPASSLRDIRPRRANCARSVHCLTHEQNARIVQFLHRRDPVKSRNDFGSN